MDSNAILHEVQQLYNVSDRLDTLAEQHPLVSEALITIAGSVRSTATVLEVLVATKNGAFRTRASKRLIFLITVWGVLFVGSESGASRVARLGEVNCERAMHRQPDNQ